MFLIETKFISKLFKKFRRRNECQEIPRLRLFDVLAGELTKEKTKQNEGSRNKNKTNNLRLGTQDFRNL